MLHTALTLSQVIALCDSCYCAVWHFAVYGPSESLPCLGVSGRAVSRSPCPGSECRTLHVSVMSPKCYLRHKSFVCKAYSRGQRRNSDFSSQNTHGFSQRRNRENEERDSSDDLDESEFLSTKNGPLLSPSNSEKHYATAAPGEREREIVELFRKVQAQLRQRAAIKEERRSKAGKEQNNKGNEKVGALLQLLKKHAVEQGKRKVNGGVSNEFDFDRASPQQSGKSNEEKGKGFFESTSIIREERQETNNKPSFSRPVSTFRRKSPVPRIRYEPIVSSEGSFDSVSYSEVDEKSGETYSEPDLQPEAESAIEPEIDLSLGLERDQEEEEDEEDEELETAVQSETVPVNGHAAEFSDAEEDNVDKREAEKQHTELKDLNAMTLAKLKALAKARGIKGYSKLKKSALVGLLSEDGI